METTFLFTNFTFSQLLHASIKGALILVITMVVAHLVTRTITRIFLHDGNPVTETTLFINAGRVLSWSVGIYIFLKAVFDVDASAIITALGVGGIAVSLGMQDTLSNLIGGVQVTLMGLIKPGDNIKIGSESGVVQDVTWRHTTITNLLGDTIVIPNSIISKNALVQHPEAEQVKVPFAVVDSGARDMEEIRAQIISLSKAAAESVCALECDPDVLFTEITEYGFKGRVRVIMAEPSASNANAIVDAVIRVIAPITRGV